MCAQLEPVAFRSGILPSAQSMLRAKTGEFTQAESGAWTCSVRGLARACGSARGFSCRIGISIRSGRKRRF